MVGQPPAIVDQVDETRTMWSRLWRLDLIPAYVILGFLLTFPVTGAANTFGTGCCEHADSSYHTWLDSSEGLGSGAWAWYVEDSFNNDLNAQTDMSEGEVTYHYNSGLTYPYVDVSWWTESLPAPAIGNADCDKFISASVCDHYHVKFNYPTSSSATTRRHTSCHEIGHSVGLGHATSSGSCMWNSSSTGTAYGAHDITHLNGRY